MFITLFALELSDTVQIIARGEQPDTERKLLRSPHSTTALEAGGASR